MSSKFNLPTETVDLPSKGLLYPKESPLSSGTIEMKYMTAKEEDILTNQNYITNGTVVDKLLQSLIVTKGVDYGSLLIGDKNAIMMAARVLSYGKDYQVSYAGEVHTVDLSQLKEKQIDFSILESGNNSFEYELPKTGNTVTFKLLTHQDEKEIEKEIEGLKKIDKDSSTEVTTRLKHTIIAVNGSTEKKDIRDFVDNYLLAVDARAFREHYNKVSPDLELKFYPENGPEEGVDIPIGIGFFWPDL